MDTLKVFRCDPRAVLPARQGEDNAGYDLCTLEDFSIAPGQSVVVRTGLVVQPPPGYHTEILLRSSMAWKHNIMLRNGVGLIDRSYAGPEDELKIMLYCLPHLAAFSYGHVEMYSTTPAKFTAGDRVAQLVLRKTHVLDVEELTEAPGLDTRGGFGSTGK